MKTIILRSLVFGFLIVTASAQNNPKITTKDILEINQLVEDLSNKDKFSGTVLIAKGNEIIYQKAVGFANKENNLKNNIDTKFNLASMNKMFTGIAIAQLVEKNQLNYTDKVVKYLPNLPKKTFGNITIEQLLTHTSGTGDFFTMPNFIEIKDTAKTINSYVALGIDQPLIFEPGSKFEYSNYGYILLGAVIETVSKTNYFDFVKHNIFSKAGMKNTDSYESDQATENMAIGYALPPQMPSETPKPIDEKTIREANTPFIEVKGTSAGGGYSTVIDLHKFSQALLSGKLLSKNSLEIVTKGKVKMQFAMPPNAKPMLMPEIKYGYGFGESFKNNIRIIGHTGGAPGIDCKIDIYPDLGYSVIVLSNYDRGSIPIANLIENSITKKQ
jgi:CubicO group peptidase (beta-lactamase class C family)